MLFPFLDARIRDSPTRLPDKAVPYTVTYVLQKPGKLSRVMLSSVGD
jgi:hypothetical protein